MQQDKNYGGLDYFRLTASILIIAIHTSPLTSINNTADFFLTRILARVAVPFFFMITGQFVISGFLHGTEKTKVKPWNQIKKLLILYGFAALFYLPIGIYAGHYKGLAIADILRMIIFDGTFYHLWYFPACITGILIVYLMSRFMQIKNITAAVIILYIIGLFGDSYFGLINGIPVISAVYDSCFHIFTYTRNGIFFAPLFLVLGGMLAGNKSLNHPYLYYSGLALSFTAMTAEAFTLKFFNLQRHDSMYIALIPTMFFLYKIIMSWNIKPSKFFRNTATRIYIFHPAIIVIVRGAAKITGMTDFLVNNSLLHYTVVTIMSVSLSAIISIIIMKPEKETFHKGRSWIEIDRNALYKNVCILRSMLPDKCRLMPAVKADAYGHGAVLIAKELNHYGVDAFCVACINEGIELRKNGIKGEILILGYTHPDQFNLLRRFSLTQTVIDYSYAIQLNHYGKRLHVHIGIDTGMHRLGERFDNTDRLIDIFQMKNLSVDGLFTHLCAADTMQSQNKSFTETQIKSFYDAVSKLKMYGFKCPRLHLISSYGLFNYPEAASDYARIGIALYGVLSDNETTKKLGASLQPVLSLKARIASVKDLYSGEYAGYGMQFTADHNMKIAALAIGYADGLPRSLSNGKGAVLINGYKCPIIGLICMDQTIVDVSIVPDVRTGDIAVLIGTSGDNSISVCDIAKQADTITNDILSRMGARLERFTV